MNLTALYDSGAVRRFHTVADYSGGTQQSVAEHSWGVALILRELCERHEFTLTRDLLFTALIHDAEELYVGDMPAPTKWRFPELARAMTVAEEVVREELRLPLYVLTTEERALLKWADGLELYTYAQRRARDGATAYRRTALNIRLYMLANLPQYPAALSVMAELTLEGLIDE